MIKIRFPPHGSYSVLRSPLQVAILVHPAHGRGGRSVVWPQRAIGVDVDAPLVRGLQGEALQQDEKDGLVS